MRRRAVLPAAVILTGAWAAAAAPGAAGQEGRSEVYEHVELSFPARAPGVRTGFHWHVAQRVVAPDAQPPPVRRARLRFPAGTRFDTAAVARCAANDERIVARGAAACPRASRLGGGSATVYLGTPDQLAARVDVHNARGEAILVLSTRAGDVLRVLRGRVRGSVIDATLPRVPLPGGREAALTSLSVRLRAAGTRSRPWLRTPRRCPASGAWRFVYDIAYDDPPGRQRPFSLSPCRR
jgi:hypothetical protein